MKRKETARDVQKRYLDALKAIHNTLKYTDSINVSKVISEYRLSRSMYAPLKEGGIIKTNGMVGKGCKYEWIGKEPSLEMAIELYNRLNSQDKRPNTRKGKKPIERKWKTKTTKKSYLWGMYVIETVEPLNK